MQSAGGTFPLKAGAESETTVFSKFDSRELVADSAPEEKEEKTEAQDNRDAISEAPQYTFDEAKHQEIKSHLKTVILVSVLCLVLLGIVYFLELKMHWVEQILLSSYFNAK